MSMSPKPLARGTPPIPWIMAHERILNCTARNVARGISIAIRAYGRERLLHEDWTDIMDLNHAGKTFCRKRAKVSREQRIFLAYHARRRPPAAVEAVSA